MVASYSISPKTFINKRRFGAKYLLLDVRIDEDVAADPTFIPGSMRYPAAQVSSLVDHYPNHDFLVICHKGLKLSQGAAAILRHHGRTAFYLEGGHVGWREQDQPTITTPTTANDETGMPTYWVLAEAPGLLPLATCWMIRRFIDPSAAFLFVEPDQVDLVADRFSAHNLGQGPTTDKNIFDSVLSAADLNDTSLLKFSARIANSVAKDQGLATDHFRLDDIRRGFIESGADGLSLLDRFMDLFDSLYAAQEVFEATHD